VRRRVGGLSAGDQRSIKFLLRRKIISCNSSLTMTTMMTIEMIDLVSMDNIEMIFFFAIHELYIDIYILLTTYIIFFL